MIRVEAHPFRKEFFCSSTFPRIQLYDSLQIPSVWTLRPKCIFNTFEQLQGLSGVSSLCEALDLIQFEREIACYLTY